MSFQNVLKAARLLRMPAMVAAIGLGIAIVKLPELLAGMEFDNPDILFHLRPIIHRYFSTGELWNDAILNGVSLVENPTYGLFYFVNALYYGLDFNFAYKAVYFVHYPLLALALWWWGCELGASRRIALVVTALFCCSGFFVSLGWRAQHLFFPVPWLIMAAAAFTRGRRWATVAPFVVSGIFWGTAVLAGDLMMLPYGFALLATCLMDSQARAMTLAHRLQLSILNLTTAALSMAATCGFALVYAWMSLQLSDRASGLPLAQATAFSFHPIRLLEFFVDLFGSPFDPEFKGAAFTSQLSGTRAVWWIPSLYFGPLALVLFGGGIGLALRKRSHHWYVILLGACLGVAFGKWNPLFISLLEHFPNLRMVRYPEKLLVLFVTACFPLALLGATHGWTRCLSALKTWGRDHQRLAAAIGIAVLLAPPLFDAGRERYISSAVLRNPPLLAEKFLNDPLLNKRALVEGAPPHSRLSAANAALLQRSTLLYGIPTWDLIDATATPLDYNFTSEIFDAREAREQFGVTHLFLAGPLPANLESAISAGALEISSKDEQGPVWLLRDPVPMPRFFLVSRWIEESAFQVASAGQEFRLTFAEGETRVTPDLILVNGLLRSGRERYSEALFTPALETTQCYKNLSVSPSESPTAWDFSVSSNCPSLLAANLRFTPGWRASVGAREIPILRINDRVVGIPLTAGSHEVKLRFDPPFHRAWVNISLVFQWLAFALGIAWMGQGPKDLSSFRQDHS